MLRRQAEFLTAAYWLRGSFLAAENPALAHSPPWSSKPKKCFTCAFSDQFLLNVAAIDQHGDFLHDSFLSTCAPSNSCMRDCIARIAPQNGAAMDFHSGRRLFQTRHARAHSVSMLRPSCSRISLSRRSASSTRAITAVSNSSPDLSRSHPSRPASAEPRSVGSPSTPNSSAARGTPHVAAISCRLSATRSCPTDPDSRSLPVPRASFSFRIRAASSPANRYRKQPK